MSTILECNCSSNRGLCAEHQNIRVPPVAPSAYGNADEHQGKQTLAGLIGNAKKSMQRLQELVDIADRETNTQAKAVALEEVVRIAQNCKETYFTLAVMKNCGFVDYNAKV